MSKFGFAIFILFHKITCLLHFTDKLKNSMRLLNVLQSKTANSEESFFVPGMSGGIAYVLDPKALFPKRCNPEMVDLDPVVAGEEDERFLFETITEFAGATGSQVALELLKSWPEPVQSFVKVFPREYRRALAEEASRAETNGAANGNGVKEEEKAESSVVDIEEAIPDGEREEKAQQRSLDKLRGFKLYSRTQKAYRETSKRLEDWDEIYNHKGVRAGLKKQAARCMECGVPFCQSDNGCPLGNVIPKWNDLVFHVSSHSFEISFL